MKRQYMVTGKDTKVGTDVKSVNSKYNLVNVSDLNRIRESTCVQLPRRSKASDDLSGDAEASKTRKMSILAIEKQKKLDADLDANKNKHLVEVSSARMGNLIEQAQRDIEQLVAFAKVQTIRDAQIEEKNAIRKETREEEIAKDRMMEEQRLIQVQQFDMREASRIENMKRGCRVVLEQMSEREKQKFVENEKRLKERQLICRQLEYANEQDALKYEMKQQQSQQVLAAILEANKHNSQMKRLAREKERMEDNQVMEYLKEQDAKAIESDAAKKEEYRQREIELTKLRLAQEKNRDRQLERDTLAAKRAADTAERLAREKERELVERNNKITNSLMEARIVQEAEKELQLIEEARIEKVEYDRMVCVQEALRAAAIEKQEKDRLLATEHGKQLEMQITANKEMDMQQKINKREESNYLRALRKKEADLVKDLKARKVDEMKTLNIPQNHTINLIKYSVPV